MKKNYQLLIVDDEVANLQKLRRTFVDEFQVFEAESGEEALAILKENTVAAIIADQRMPGMKGVDLLRQSLELNPDAVRIILTGYTEVEDLMDSINRGHVHRYITKPWEPFSLKQMVKHDLERWELKRENQHLAEQLSVANEQLQKENLRLKQHVDLLKNSGSRLIFKSQTMRELFKLVDRAVETDSTVLIQGETGTGKELLARYIHENSPRRHQAFVPVNCGAIPADLVESAFFGHKKGAFTGATENRKGYFELADEGTLYLDEIGEAPLDLQVKLLRVLQEREIFPVGAQQSKQIDVRIVVSSNRDLSCLAEQAHFRHDLFFRLNVFAVRMPPLRVRQDDIEVLCHYFLERFQQRLNKHIPGLEDATLKILKAYYWPGNVRELENEIERMAILCDPDQLLAPSMLSERMRFYQNDSNSSAGLLKEKLADLERGLILEALKNHRHNKSHAAQSLGISRQTIISKLKQYENSQSSLQ